MAKKPFNRKEYEAQQLAIQTALRQKSGRRHVETVRRAPPPFDPMAVHSND